MAAEQHSVHLSAGTVGTGMVGTVDEGTDGSRPGVGTVAAVVDGDIRVSGYGIRRADDGRGGDGTLRKIYKFRIKHLN